MDKSKQSFDKYVKLSVASEIPPLELEFYPIVDIEDRSPLAFRTKFKVHSFILGDLEENKYTKVSDNHDTAKIILQRQIMHVVRAYKQFLRNEKEVEFISMRCPRELIGKVSIASLVEDVLKKYSWFNTAKLVLEFDGKLLEDEFEKIKIALLDIKVLKVKTAILGCGKDDFLLSKLATITPDYVFLDKSATAYAGSRNKPQLVRSLIDYIKSMGSKTVCEGVEENRKNLRNTDCVGFYDVESKKLTLKKALELEGDNYE